MDITKQPNEYMLLLIAIPDTIPSQATTGWDTGHEMESLSAEFLAAGRELTKLPCTVGLVYTKSANPCYKNWT